MVVFSMKNTTIRKVSATHTRNPNGMRYLGLPDDHEGVQQVEAEEDDSASRGSDVGPEEQFA